MTDTRTNFCLFFAAGAKRVLEGWRPRQECTGGGSPDFYHVHVSEETYRRLEMRGGAMLVDAGLRIVTLRDAVTEGEK